MNLIEKIMERGDDWIISYYPASDSSHSIADEQLVADGWTIRTQNISFNECDELTVCRIMESSAYRFRNGAI